MDHTRPRLIPLWALLWTAKARLPAEVLLTRSGSYIRPTYMSVDPWLFNFKNPKTYFFGEGAFLFGPTGPGVAVPEVSVVVPTISITFIFIKFKIFLWFYFFRSFSDLKVLKLILSLSFSTKSKMI